MFDYNRQRNHLSKINNNKKFDVATAKSIWRFRDKVYKINSKLFAIFINNKIK